MYSKYETENLGFEKEETVYVHLTGIANESRCITDLTKLCTRIKSKLKEIEQKVQIKNGISHIIIGGNFDITKRLDSITKENTFVTGLNISYKRFLRDGGESGENYTIKSVKRKNKTIEDAFKEMGRELSEPIDLSKNSERAKIDRCVIKHLPIDRYRRAKQKSQAKQLDRVANDWFNNTPTAGHILLVGDGITPTGFITEQIWNGDSPYLKYPEAFDGSKTFMNAKTGKDGSLDIQTAKIFVPDYYENIRYSDLTPTAQQQVNQWMSPQERRLHNYPNQFESGSTSFKSTNQNKNITTAD